MPTVPYASKPRVGVAPLPGARINSGSNVEAFGGGIASEKGTLGDLSGAVGAAQRITSETQRVQFEEKAKADQIATTHAYSQLITGTNDILHGPDGVLNRMGQDAFTSDQDAYDRYGKHVADIRESLGTDDQRAIFDKMALNEWNSVDSQVQPHIARQRKLYDKQGTDAGIEANNVRAQSSFDNPDIVDDAIAHNQALAAGYLKRQGAPDQEIENVRAKVESDMRLDVLKQFVDTGQDLSASSYFSTYKDKFVGDSLVKAETLTKRGSVEGEAIRQADAITKTAKDEGAAFEQAASIAEPQVREKAEQRISLYFNRKAAATRQTQDDAFQRGYQTLRLSGWDLTKVPLSVRNQMGAMHEENLVRASEHQQKLARDGGPGDAEQFTTLLNESYFDPETFASRNILDVQGLNTKQLNRLQTLQRSVGRQVEAPLRADLSHAESAVRAAQKAMDADPKSDAAIEQWKTATLEKVRAENELHAHGQVPPSVLHLDRTASLKMPTEAMSADIARAKAAGDTRYLDLLRAHGVDVSAAKLPPAEDKPAAKKKP